MVSVRRSIATTVGGAGNDRLSMQRAARRSRWFCSMVNRRVGMRVVVDASNLTAPEAFCTELLYVQFILPR